MGLKMNLIIEKGAEAILKSLNIDKKSAVRWKSKVISATSPARVVIEYSFYRGSAVSDPQPFLRLIGKFYTDEEGRTTYQNMKALQASLLRSEASPLLAIPDPIFYDSGCRLIVQQYLNGNPYHKMIDHPDHPRYFSLAGRALATLHALDVPDGETKLIEDHLKELIHPHPMAFCEAFPEYRQSVIALIKEMRKREREWDGKIEISPIHRDFHLRQLFYGGGKMWLIDWDLFAKGDPALDVGNFIVYLRTRLTQRCSPSIDAFLEGYFSERPAAILKRVSLYQAFTYLRLACKRFRLKGDLWRERVNEMLLKSEECLMVESNEAV